jgi:hypothetical protein
MDSELRVIVGFLYREKVTQNQIHGKLKAQFADDAYSLYSVQR